MLRVGLIVLVLVVLGCKAEFDPPAPLCPPSATATGQKIQQIAMQAFGICIQDSDPGSNPQSLTGGGGCSAAGEDPCGACIVTCSAKSGDNCADDTPSAATIACAREQCATVCQ